MAPAGDIEAGYAALYYGADAVYLGLQQFSARATAANFDEESLNRFVGYAHALGRKVFAAVNTVVQEAELPELLKTLDICSCCRVDAVIIQDLGVARVVRENYPELEMHASTQMAVHNKEGALALQRLGFSRVVLARELTLAEIREIAAIPGLETEAFIHGALCYSYSGLCLFSSLESGRSANRGKCLYPCRAEFAGEDGKMHYFSMKDMALQEDVLKMPVTSLKIEGRKKTALYVAAVTDYYRRLLDGKATGNGAENIKQIFSRPWCRFHFNGRDKDVIERNFVGHRGLKTGKIEQAGKKSFMFHPLYDIGRYDGIQIEVPGTEKPFGFSVQQLRENGRNVYTVRAGSEAEIGLPPQAPKLYPGWEVFLASSTKVKGAYDYAKPKPGEYRQKEAADTVVRIEAHRVSAEAGGQKAELEGVFGAARQPEKVAEAVKKAFKKSGDAEVRLGNLEIDNPQGLFVPVSVLNELRRRLYAVVRSEHKQGKLPPVAGRQTLPPDLGNRTVLAGDKTNSPRWIVRTDNVDNLAGIDLSEVAEVIVMPDETFDGRALSALPKNKVRLGLPAVNRRVSAWKPMIERLLAQGYRKWEIANYWGREVLPAAGIDLSLDAPVYMFNTQAAVMAAELGAGRLTLAWEDTPENMKQVAAASCLPVVLDVYGDIPLFTSAACIRSNPCRGCPRGTKRMSLSRDGKTYAVLSKDCQTMLFDERPYCCATAAKDIAADFYRISFMYKAYSAGEAAEIWRTVRQFKDCPGSFDGNFRRGKL